MLDRSFVEEGIAGQSLRLTGAEARHLGQVLRARPGRRVVLFDGRGGEWLAEVLAVDRAGVELAVLSHEADDRMPARRLTLAVALPKGDRQRLLVEKCVELGVAALVPLATERGVAEATPSALDRLRRYGIEACKQCGRNRLLDIGPALDMPTLLRESAVGLRALAHPGGESLAALSQHAERTTVAIGPEGGFSDEEVAQARRAGWRIVGLGPRILRVETAAAMTASLVLAESSDASNRIEQRP